MKRYLLLLIVALLLVTGCNKNKTIICEKETKTDTNLVMKHKVTLEYEDDYVKELEMITTSDLSETTYNRIIRSRS